MEAYTKQLQGKYVPRNMKVIYYYVDNIEVKETNVLQIDFSVATKRLNVESISNWNGVLENSKISCQWVLWFEVKELSGDRFLYTVTKLQRPAGYDLEKYQTSGQKEKDEYNQKYKAEKSYEQKQFTYKIEKGICYISYDSGSTWKKVPIELNSLVEVGDGNTFYNKLQDRSYIITPKKTAFVYGGTRKSSLKIAYS